MVIMSPSCQLWYIVQAITLHNFLHLMPVHRANNVVKFHNACFTLFQSAINNFLDVSSSEGLQGNSNNPIMVSDEFLFIYYFIYLFIYFLATFSQGCPVQQCCFKWGPELLT